MTQDSITEHNSNKSTLKREPAPPFDPDRNKKEKKENLKQRAYLNSITSVLDYGAKVITGFVVTPFLVSGLGSMLFGVWEILKQFTDYTSMADIQATQVLKWAVAKDRGSKSDEKLRQYVTATFLLILLILPLLLIAGAVITWYAPAITRVDPEYADLVRITCALLIVSLIINKVFSIFESILRGMNLGFKRMGFRAAVFVVGGGLQIGAILLGYGLIELAMIQIFVVLTIGITLYVIVKRHVSWFGFGKADFKQSLSFLKLSGWFMSWTGIRLLILKSDKVLLGFLAGPVMVTQYVITQYLISAVRGMVFNVIHGVIPGIGKLYGNREFDKLFKIREHMLLLTWILVVTIGAAVIAFNGSFINLWVGEGHFAGPVINLLILLVIAQYIFIENDSAIINTTLDITEKVYMGLVSAGISIAVIFLLVGDYGIAGLCIGMMAGRMVMTIGYPRVITKKTGRRMEDTRIPYRPLLATIAIWSAVYWISSFIEIHSWIVLVAAVAMSMIGLLPVTYFAGLNKMQRSEIKAYTSRIRVFSSEG